VRPGMERPLIVMTPKSLLRSPAASSSVDQLASGGFLPIIDDSEVTDPTAVERVVLCSGKIFYDLNEARKQSDVRRVAIVRLEQFYPFALSGLREISARYSKAKQLVWAQEEPKNMGGWTFLEARLADLMPAGEQPRYVGRAASASPATGSYSIQQKEQSRLVAEALDLSS